jgi:hypothetical protein
VSYWIGSGNHARSYLSRTAYGELLELPATRYAEAGGRWGMSPGYSRPDHAGFSRKINYACMYCHNDPTSAHAYQRSGHRETPRHNEKMPRSARTDTPAGLTEDYPYYFTGAAAVLAAGFTVFLTAFLA